MAHQYSTDAVVLGAYNTGEANKTYVLFTEMFGLVYCQARSVRKEGAKLSAHLQPLSLTRVSLIRGKKGWKIVGSVEMGNVYYDLRHTPLVRDMIVRIVKLLRRLVRGEEKNERLYISLSQGIEYCVSNEGAELAVDSIERLLALRMLAALGYMTPLPQFAPLLTHDTVEDGDVALLVREHRAATQEINTALKNAQL
jgi:DNA repair protein RecO